MITLLTDIGSLVTVNANGGSSRTGAAMRDVGEIKNAAVLFDSRIRWIGTSEEAERKLASGEWGAVDVVPCEGRTVLPGFVDSHTHMVFAGSRAHEFARRLSGVPYTQIAAEGGGILTTMRAVREASLEDLVARCDDLVSSALQQGTTSLEIKSGYGLTLQDELKLLDAARAVRDDHVVRIKLTFLGAHAVPPEYKQDPEGYVRHIIEDMIPAVAEAELADFCDVFIDAGFFTAEQGERILRAAQEHGMRAKVHADEIAIVGAVDVAARVGAFSADHLEHTTIEGMHMLRDAGVVATLLPGTAYTLRLPYPDARTMIDEGLTVALATDCNPGSCFTENMQTILSLACINCGMSIEEAITAATLHGAAALGMADEVGSIEVGKRADIVLYDCPSYEDLVYHFGTNQVWGVWVGGEESA
jgi:imidazolonepropionase